jgi:hypothetical protein
MDVDVSTVLLVALVWLLVATAIGMLVGRRLRALSEDTRPARSMTLRAACPGCGTVDLPVTAMVITPAAFRFDCPSCAEPVVGLAPPVILRLLAGAGAALDADVAPEVFESKAGPAFTERDAAALHQLLEGETWFEDLLATAESEQGNPGY